MFFFFFFFFATDADWLSDAFTYKWDNNDWRPVYLISSFTATMLMSSAEHTKEEEEKLRKISFTFAHTRADARN